MKCTIRENWLQVVFEGDNCIVIENVKGWVRGSLAPSIPLAHEVTHLASNFNSMLFSFNPRSTNLFSP